MKLGPDLTLPLPLKDTRIPSFDPFIAKSSLSLSFTEKTSPLRNISYMKTL